MSPSKRTMYQVSLGNGRTSRLYPKPKASRLARRFNRLFTTDVAYVVTFGRVNVYAYVNNSNVDLSPYHREIVAKLRSSGTLPEELADLFTVTISPQANPDGTPLYVIDAA